MNKQIMESLNFLIKEYKRLKKKKEVLKKIFLLFVVIEKMTNVLRGLLEQKRLNMIQQKKLYIMIVQY